MPNDNCLENIRCPYCGHEDWFRITLSTIVGATVDVCDDGTEEPELGEGAISWGEDSPIQCRECRNTGTVGEFTIPLAARMDPTLKPYTVQAEARVIYRGTFWAHSVEDARAQADSSGIDSEPEFVGWLNDSREWEVNPQF